MLYEVITGHSQFMLLKIRILVGTMTGTAQLCAQEMELALDDDDTQVETLLMDKLGPEA